MPARTIPTALVLGVAIVTLSYVALNVLYLAVLPVDAVRSSTRIAAEAADAVVGSGGSGLMAALVMMSSLGALTGIILTGPRVYYSMARDGLAFSWLGHVHPVYRTPSRAILFIVARPRAPATRPIPVFLLTMATLVLLPTWGVGLPLLP